MINPRQLTLIKAALQFFDEEMSPHEPAVAQAYCEETLNPPLQPGETGELRSTLSHIELRYLICDLDSQFILHRNLFQTPSEARSHGDHHISVATVFLPARQ
jgi:hypothetical protein